MPHEYFRSERFKKEYKKLDGRQQELVDKKILKIFHGLTTGVTHTIKKKQNNNTITVFLVKK